MSILLKSNQLMTNPPSNVGYAPGRALYRARFNDGNKASLAGTVTAPDVGLKQGIWVGGTNEFSVLDSNVIRGTVAGSISVGLPIPNQGVTMYWLFLGMPTGGPLYLDIFASTIGGSPDVYRLQVGATSAALSQRINNVATTLSPSFPVAAGQRVGIRWVGGLLTAFVEDTPMAEVEAKAIAPGGFVRLAAGGSTTSFTVDSPEIYTYL